MGISRSTSIVIAYLLKYKKLTIEQSLKIIKDNRSFVNPRETFVNQLKNLEERQCELTPILFKNETNGMWSC